ncbi:hypothetical protein KKF38_04745 [Patescibacteria group bacterium]|nr:hypothetical protein [Patescibacteria group bacterium]
MQRITIPRAEYQKILKQAQAYQKLASSFFSTNLKNPIDDVVEDFEKTGIYSKGFLDDLRSGLGKSSYSKPKK